MDLAFPKPDRKKRKFKRRTDQQIRSDWINLCLCLWGMIIVKRDGKCLWCQGVSGLCGHHIVTRGSTKAYKLSWFDLDNGITLCLSCHGTAHGRGRKRTIHDYVRFIDVYLEKRGTNYAILKVNYGGIYKLTLDHVKLNFNVLRAKCEGMKINYSENKRYQRLVKRLG